MVRGGRYRFFGSDEELAKAYIFGNDFKKSLQVLYSVDVLSKAPTPSHVTRDGNRMVIQSVCMSWINWKVSLAKI